MSVTTTLAACSQTVSANGPDGTVDAPSTLDDSIRYALSFVAQLRDTKAAIGANSDITALSALASINGGQLAGMRNRLINGNFAVNQRAVAGTVTLSAGAYGHDRWKAGAGGCTYTFAASGADTIITVTAGSLMQVVESVNIEGGVYTLSQAGTAQARIGVNGASPASGYVALPIASASATGGQTVTVEFTTGTVSKTQLEPGTVASVFERRHPGQEFALCQRYLPAVSASAGQTVGTGVFFSATSFNLCIPFQVTSRGSPTGATISASNALTIVTSGAANPTTAISFGAASTQAAELYLTVAGVGGNGGLARATGLISILFTGCEL